LLLRLVLFGRLGSLVESSAPSVPKARTTSWCAYSWGARLMNVCFAALPSRGCEQEIDRVREVAPQANHRVNVANGFNKTALLSCLHVNTNSERRARCLSARQCGLDTTARQLRVLTKHFMLSRLFYRQ
jgi:hypothetical protein